MAHEWKVVYCEYGMEDVPVGQVKVTELHWSCFKEDTGDSGNAYGTINASDQDRVYTLSALQAVPESVMVGWAKDALGAETVQQIEDAIDVQIAQKKTPTTGGFAPT